LTNRFCALAYAPSRTSEAQLHNKWIIALFIDCPGSLCILIEPEWQKRVDSADVAYFNDLFADLRIRRKYDAPAIFRQVCVLNNGLLLTYKSGDALLDCPELLDLYLKFVDIDQA
jgi:hypothetical protein